MIIIAKFDEKYRLLAHRSGGRGWLAPQNLLSQNELIDLMLRSDFHQTDIGDTLSEANKRGIGYISSKRL